MILRKKLEKWDETVLLIDVQFTTYKDKEKVLFTYSDSKNEVRTLMFTPSEFLFRMIDRMLLSVNVPKDAIENLYKDNENLLTLCQDYNAMLASNSFVIENEIKYVKELKKEIVSKKFKPNN